MSLQSIQSYCGKKNFAGNTHIQCVPIQWIDAFPDFAKDGHNISEQITLKAGKNWLVFPCVPDTLDFRERERSGNHGSEITPTISGFLPGDTPSIASVLNSAKANQWIVILYYKTGEAKLVGSPDYPARFGSSFNNRGELNSGKGYEIEFYSQSAVKSFFVEETPDPFATVCQPVTIQNAQSSPSYSHIIASGDTFVLPKEDINVNGVLLVNKNSVEDYNVLVVDSNDDPVATSIVAGKVQVDDLPSQSTQSRSTAELLKSGQIAELRTGDDGYWEAGRAVDFLTLSSVPVNNDGSPTANVTTYRFTDLDGNPVSVATVQWIIDWSTFNGSSVIGYVNGFWGLGSDFTWEEAVDFCNNYSLAGFSNCRLANVKEAMNLIYYGAKGLDYPPFNTGDIDTWLSTSLYINTSFAHNTIFGDGRILYTGKTNTKRAMPVRTFTVIGTDLT